MKRERLKLKVIIGILATVLFVTSFLFVTALFFWMVAPAPVDAARLAAVAKGQTELELGLEVNGLTHSDSYFFGESAIVRLNSSAGGNFHAIEVVLKRPIWSPNWRVERYKENGKEQ